MKWHELTPQPPAEQERHGRVAGRNRKLVSGRHTNDFRARKCACKPVYSGQLYSKPLQTFLSASWLRVGQQRQFPSLFTPQL